MWCVPVARRSSRITRRGKAPWRASGVGRGQQQRASVAQAQARRAPFKHKLALGTRSAHGAAPIRIASPHPHSPCAQEPPPGPTPAPPARAQAHARAGHPLRPGSFHHTPHATCIHTTVPPHHPRPTWRAAHCPVASGWHACRVVPSHHITCLSRRLGALTPFHSASPPPNAFTTPSTTHTAMRHRCSMHQPRCGLGALEDADDKRKAQRQLQHRNREQELDPS